MASKTLARGFAGMAGHGFSPLALSGEKSHTIYGSRAWVTPRFGLAPRPVRAGGGALFEGRYLSRWFDGYFYRVTGRSERDLNRDAHCGFLPSRSAPASDTRRGGSYLNPNLRRFRPLIEWGFLGLWKSLIGNNSGQTAGLGRTDDRFIRPRRRGYKACSCYVPVSLLTSLICEGLNLAGFLHAAQCGVDARHRIRVQRQIHLLSHLYPGPDLSRREPFLAGPADPENRSDRIRKSGLSGKFVEPDKVAVSGVLILDHLCKRLQGIRVFRDLPFSLRPCQNGRGEFSEHLIHCLYYRRTAHV